MLSSLLLLLSNRQWRTQLVSELHWLAYGAELAKATIQRYARASCYHPKGRCLVNAVSNATFSLIYTSAILDKAQDARSLYKDSLLWGRIFCYHAWESMEEKELGVLQVKPTATEFPPNSL